MSMDSLMNMEKDTNIQEETQMINRTYTNANTWNAERLEQGLIKSQKAIALWGYKTYGKSEVGYRSPNTLYVLVDDDPFAVVDWAESNINVSKDIFVRTCPLNPRHGVLESTRCSNHKTSISDTVTHLQNIMKEHDPEGCLIVQAYQPASASCVLAPNMYVVFGEGHDGVTAGTNYSDAGTSLVLPLDSKGCFARGLDIMSEYTEHTYDVNKHEIEMVFTDSYDRSSVSHDTGTIVRNRNWDDEYQANTRVILTQIRGCDEHIPIGTPPLGVNINGSIPDGDVTVTQTVVMSGLEQVQWLEDNITKELCPDGFVVVEPNGSLLSHINAHCRTHGVPYIVTDKVCVGDTWTEVASGWVVQNNDGQFVADPYNPFQYISAFRDGVTYGNSHWMRKQSALSTYFHQWMGQPNNDPELSAFLGGVFCAWIVKATIGATVGEMRHARSMKKNYTQSVFMAMNAFIGTEENELATQHGYDTPVPNSREPYHYWMRNTLVDWEGASSLLTYMEREYKTGWSTAYGGPKWGDGAGKGARVATLIHKLMQASDDELEDTGKLLAIAVNALENAVHNNGGLLNKFGSDTMTHFNAGTHGYQEGEMRFAYQSYMIAMDIVNDRIPTYAQECPVDWTVIADYFSKTAGHWRTSPLLARTDAPTDVQVVIDAWGDSSFNKTQFRHSNSEHSYGITGSSKYIPCGASSCSTCASHMSKMQKQQPKVSTSTTDDVWLLGVSGTQGSKALTPSVSKHVLNAQKKVKMLKWSPLNEFILNEFISVVCNEIEANTYSETEHVYAELMYTLEPTDLATAMNAIELALSLVNTQTKEMKE